MTHNEKDQGEAIAKAIRALFMKSDFQTIINSDQMFKKHKEKENKGHEMTPLNKTRRSHTKLSNAKQTYVDQLKAVADIDVPIFTRNHYQLRPSAP